MKKILQSVSQILFGTRKNCDRIVSEIARKSRNKKILEIGSGKKVNGKNIYSYKKFFDESNDFLCSDMNPAFGHEKIDITQMNIKERYDIILCLNVLEHVYDYEKAIENMHNALKKGGTIVCFTPYIYPLHDLPHDYFRFSKNALQKMFSMYSKLEIKHFGLKRFPSGYYVKASK